jgi:glycosyltransferase involved in cell wall biosynthesis
MFEKLVAPETEEEITKHWTHTDKVYTSVICATFNQEMYIRDAIDSFLAQITHYKFEVIIHDDVSTDNTREILKGYQQQYPSIIKLILQDTNQYSMSINLPGQHSFAEAAGEYIAFCEGDDFWIDKHKLQSQIYELESNMDIDLCFHSAFTFDGAEAVLITKYADMNSVITVESVIEKNYGQIATASSFIRRAALVEYDEYVRTRHWLTVGDIYEHFFSAKRGGAIYVDTPMSVYRINVPGSWVQTLDSEILKNHIEQEINSYHELNELTKYKYIISFNKSNIRNIKWILWSQKMPLKMRFMFFLKYRKYFNVSLQTANSFFAASVPFYIPFYVFMKKYLGQAN